VSDAVDLDQPIAGRAWVFGDSVDTNQLAGGGLTGATREETLRLNCLRGLRPEFSDGVRAGDILVAGHNFGCGSSRQSAVEALRVSGIAAVLAESVARIHRRNSIALALPTFEVPGITGLVTDRDIVEIEHGAGEVRDQRTGAVLAMGRLPESVLRIYRAGGLVEVIRSRLAESGIHPTA
jgi:3-isopropylmalate/(R)-2-methylmalate dehydratase small subunit